LCAWGERRSAKADQWFFNRYEGGEKKGPCAGRQEDHSSNRGVRNNAQLLKKTSRRRQPLSFHRVRKKKKNKEIKREDGKKKKFGRGAQWTASVAHWGNSDLKIESGGGKTGAPLHSLGKKSREVTGYPNLQKKKSEDW